MYLVFSNEKQDFYEWWEDWNELIKSANHAFFRCNKKSWVKKFERIMSKTCM